MLLFICFSLDGLRRLTFFSAATKKSKQKKGRHCVELIWIGACRVWCTGIPEISSKPWEPLSTRDKGIKKFCAKRSKSLKNQCPRKLDAFGSYIQRDKACTGTSVLNRTPKCRFAGAGFPLRWRVCTLFPRPPQPRIPDYPHKAPRRGGLFCLLFVAVDKK